VAFEPVGVAVAAGICVGMAALGAAVTGTGVRTWYPTIRHPSFEPPLWGFVLIGMLVYLLEGIVLYRLLTNVDDRGGRVVAVAALVIVMLYNELWNAALFRLRSPFAAFIGLLGFLAPLGILEVALFVYEPASGWLMLVYVAWVLVYDVQWSYRLWRLNAADS
jgi:tryptophan-rich sensory protein